MQGRTMLAWDHWHIEPSSICTLKCPRCPRAEVPESLLNRQLTLDFFKNRLGQSIVKQIKKITFCGNDGDPIYCRELTEICSWLKSVNPNINLVIITNGSYKNDQWWINLAQVLDHHDEIHWSIDGWDQASNEQYRVNSDWNSIVSGIKAFSGANTTAYRVWAAIAFRFNQDYLNRMMRLAETLQFDSFQLTKSTKFGSKYPVYGTDDCLEPTDAKLIAQGNRFERQSHVLSRKIKPGNELQQIFLQRAQDLAHNQQYSGVCLIGNKGVFLNSQGEFYPCCWTANRYDHNSEWHTQAQQRFNLHNRTFEEIIDDIFWTTDFLKFNSLECNTKCTREKLTDTQHTTEW